MVCSSVRSVFVVPSLLVKNSDLWRTLTCVASNGLTRFSMAKWHKVNQYLNSFWWIIKLFTYAFYLERAITITLSTFTLFPRLIAFALNRLFFLQTFRTNAIALGILMKAITNFKIDSELIQILVYFMLLCHGRSCTMPWGTWSSTFSHRW